MQHVELNVATRKHFLELMSLIALKLLNEVNISLSHDRRKKEEQKIQSGHFQVDQLQI